MGPANSFSSTLFLADKSFALSLQIQTKAGLKSVTLAVKATRVAGTTVTMMSALLPGNASMTPVFRKMPFWT